MHLAFYAKQLTVHSRSTSFSAAFDFFIPGLVTIRRLSQGTKHTLPKTQAGMREGREVMGFGNWTRAIYYVDNDY